MNEQILYNRPLPGVRLNMAHPLTRDLHGLWLLNENGGVRAMDPSPYRRDMLLKGFASPPLRSFNGLQFDGTDDYAVTDGAEPVTSSFSVITWIKSDSWVFAYVASQGGEAGADNGWSMATLANNNVRLTLHGVGNYDTTNAPLTANSWQMIALSLNGTALKFYHNGSLINSQTAGAIAAGSHRYSFANVPDGGAVYGSLRIAQGLFYKRILGDDEIKRLYQSPYDMFMKRED